MIRRDRQRRKDFAVNRKADQRNGRADVTGTVLCPCFASMGGNKMGRNDLEIIAGRFLSVAILISVLFLTEGIGILSQRRSDPWQYERAMEKADACYADGKWQEAYEAYVEALSYESGDEEVLRRAVLSNLERVKESGNPRHLIQTYCEIFKKYAELFSETELSGWYFECADAYLEIDAPMGAVALLEDGMDIFPEAETAENMREKKKDILAHTEIKYKTNYYLVIMGEEALMKLNSSEYDEEGREIFRLDYDYHGNKENWDYISYDESGNEVYRESWYIKEEGPRKVYETYTSYDENGNLLHYVTYRFPERDRKDLYAEANYRYDEEGNEIYSKRTSYYPGNVIDEERERQVFSNQLEKVREYDGDRQEEYSRYIFQSEDGDGNKVTEYYDADIYSAEEILSGSAVPWWREWDIYDENGNITDRYSFMTENGKDNHITWEYDERGNMIRETLYYGRNTMLIYYNDGDLPIKKEKYYVEDGERHDIDLEYYSYDEEGNLTAKENKSDRTEYDRLGNMTKRYLSPFGFKQLDEQRIYQYHYSP